MGRFPLSDIHEKTFDVLVVGAGINGISATRHLVSQGYHVLLVDQGDFASGATGRSGRQLSNGLEYLDLDKPFLKSLNPRRLASAYKMVKATLEGRSELAKRDTGRVQPFRMFMPVYKTGPCRMWRMKFGFSLHSTFSPRDAKLAFEWLADNQSRDLPMVGWLRAPEDLQGVVELCEYFMDWPERIALDVLLESERVGAKVRNYTTIEKFEEGTDGYWLIELKDSLDEQSTENALIKTRMIVNTAGAWADRVNRRARPKTDGTGVGVKASYVAMRFPQDCREVGLTAFSRDGRLFSCIPWRGMHLLGPHTSVHQGELEDLRVDDEEIDWLIDEANFLMPILGIRRQDVFHSWASVLPRSADTLSPFGSGVTEIHDLADDGLPMLALTGGNFVAHVKTGSDIAAAVRKRVPPTGKAQSLGWKPQKPTERRQGRHISDGQNSISIGALQYAAENEHARTLSDFLFRRLGAGWNSSMSQGLAPNVAEAVATFMDWDEEEIEKQAKIYDKSIREINKVQSRSLKQSQLE